MPNLRTAALILLLLGVPAAPTLAQFNPGAGQWGKSVPTDVRIMTWNIQDDVCSTNTKLEGNTDWCAAARIVAALQPDVLILQECGDNDGEGTGTVPDTVETLSAVVDMFLHGGADIFHSGAAVTSYVQKYAPGYDLPYVYVSSVSDNYNRNVLLSRWPFKDLNGDGVSLASAFNFSYDSTSYAPGGTPGIRGFVTAEIDLPDATYAGDLVMGCMHLKSGSDSSSLSQRLTAGENIAYYLDYYFNGAGTGTPDPHNKFTAPGHPTTILNPNTPIICGGDLNESIDVEMRRGPAQWITQGAVQGGADGTDRDRTDSTYDDARDPFTSSPITESNGTKSYKDDYLLWQDSIAAAREVFVFYTPSIPGADMPAQLVDFPGGATTASNKASDHRPVVADFALPLTPPACPGDFNNDRLRNTADLGVLLSAFGTSVAPNSGADLNGDGAVNTADLGEFLNLFGNACP